MNYLDKHLSFNNINTQQKVEKINNPSIEKNNQTKKDGKKVLLASSIALAVIGTAAVLMSKGKIKGSSVKKLGKELVDETKDNLPKNFKKQGSDVVENITSDLSSKVPDKIADVVDDLPPNLTDKLTDVVDEFPPKMTDVTSGVVTEFPPKMTDVTSDVVTEFPPKMTDVTSGVVTEFPPKMTDVTSDVVTEFPPKITTEMSDAAKLQVVPNINEIKVKNVADDLINDFSDEQLAEFSEFLKRADVIDCNGEIIRHATTADKASSIRQNGYEILHSSANNGSNNFGGMDVESLNICDFGKRYGDTKLEYEYTGKAIKLTNDLTEEFKELIFKSKDPKTGESFFSKVLTRAEKDPSLPMGDVNHAVARNLLRKFGFDAIAVAPQGHTLFYTILDPVNTKGLKYIRTIAS